MNKKICPIVLASASLFMASCGKGPQSSGTNDIISSILESSEFKVSRAFRYLDFNLQEIAECDNSGWYYKPIESLDYDLFADLMIKNQPVEDVPEEEPTEGEEQTPEISAQAEDDEEPYVYNPDDWNNLGIGLDIEEGSLLLNGRTSSDISGLKAEVLLNECKLWMVSDGLETYQKVAGIKGYFDGETEAAYLDLSNASLLRLALIELVRQAYPGNDEWTLTSKTMIPLDENDLMLAKLMMPWSNRSAAIYSRLVDSIKSSYGTEGTDYCYFDNSKVKTGYYLNWIVNDISTLTTMVDDIVDNTNYPNFIKDYVKDYISSYTDYIRDFKMNIGISWTQDELRSVSLTVEAKLDEEKQIAELTEDSAMYIKSLSFEGKLMPLMDKAAEFTLPNLERYDEMQEIVGLTDQEKPTPGEDTPETDWDAYLDAIRQWIEENGGSGDWNWPGSGGGEGGDDWRDRIDDWMSSILG
ncbi:MAG: hypothetical protein MJ241_02605 [Bacilli bacterium]|nr:hypothetical protein [Bacilli bacterium]